MTSPGHKLQENEMTDALTAPINEVDHGFERPERPPFDPMAGHRAHMERIDQAGWLERVTALAFTAPIEDVEARLEELGRLKSARGVSEAKRPAKKAAPEKPAPAKADQEK